jgi:hypothetical protein
MTHYGCQLLKYPKLPELNGIYGILPEFLVTGDGTPLPPPSILIALVLGKADGSK